MSHRAKLRMFSLGSTDRIFLVFESFRLALCVLKMKMCPGYPSGIRWASPQDAAFRVFHTLAAVGPEIGCPWAHYFSCSLEAEAGLDARGAILLAAGKGLGSPAFGVTAGSRRCGPPWGRNARRRRHLNTVLS